MIEKIGRFDTIHILKPLNNNNKKTTLKEKGNPWAGEEIFTIYTTAKGLMSRICKELLQINKKNTGKILTADPPTLLWL